MSRIGPTPAIGEAVGSRSAIDSTDHACLACGAAAGGGSGPRGRGGVG